MARKRKWKESDTHYSEERKRLKEQVSEKRKKDKEKETSSTRENTENSNEEEDARKAENRDTSRKKSSTGENAKYGCKPKNVENKEQETSPTSEDKEGGNEQDDVGNAENRDTETCNRREDNESCYKPKNVRTAKTTEKEKSSTRDDMERSGNEQEDTRQDKNTDRKKSSCGEDVKNCCNPINIEDAINKEQETSLTRENRESGNEQDDVRHAENSDRETCDTREDNESGYKPENVRTAENREKEKSSTQEHMESGKEQEDTRKSENIDRKKSGTREDGCKPKNVEDAKNKEQETSHTCENMESGSEQDNVRHAENRERETCNTREDNESGYKPENVRTDKNREKESSTHEDMESGSGHEDVRNAENRDRENKYKDEFFTREDTECGPEWEDFRYEENIDKETSNIREDVKSDNEKENITKDEYSDEDTSRAYIHVESDIEFESGEKNEYTDIGTSRARVHVESDTEQENLGKDSDRSRTTFKTDPRENFEHFKTNFQHSTNDNTNEETFWGNSSFGNDDGVDTSGENIGTQRASEDNYFDSDYFQRPLGTEDDNSFKIALNISEWEKIQPSAENPYKLKPEWTEIFAEKFNIIIPGCCLSFKYHNITKTKKLKPKYNYFSCKAVCKHDDCGEFKFLITRKPEPDDSFVEITVLITKPAFPHYHGNIKKRNLKGKRRDDVKEELGHTRPSKWHYNKLGEMADEEVEMGNYTKCQSKEVLRKAKSEWNLHDVLHKDQFTETVLAKQIIEEQDEESEKIKGYIQEISYQPMLISLFTEKSVQAAKICIKNGNGVFYIDATGTVVAKSPASKKTLYYAVVINGVEKGDPPVPVLEFLSDHHGSFYIVRPLLSFFATLRKFSPTYFRPSRVESDFSWAIIHGICLSVNNMSIEHYIKYCYDAVTSDEDKQGEGEPVTIIHLCCTHMLKAFRDNVKEKAGDKNMRELLLRCFALLQNCTRLEQTTSFWKIMCLVFSSKYVTEEVTEAEKTLRKHILKASLDGIDESLICDHAEEDDEQNQSKQSGIRKSSPFFTVYSRILKDVEQNVEETGVENPLFKIEALKLFANNYLPLICLWSGMMLNVNDKTQERKIRDTNSTVENWMKIVKIDTLEKEKRMRMGLFIRKMHIVLKGRLREYLANCQRQSNTTKSQKKTFKQNSDPDGPDTAQEKWERKESGNQRTSFFYSPPKRFPSPKSGKKTKTKTQEQGSSNKPRSKSLGIRNRGNTCWLIATLQSFAALEDWSLQGDDVVLNLTNKVISKLHHAGENSAEISIESLKDAIDEQIDDLSIGIQHDSAVYVEFLMKKAEEEGQQVATEVESVLQCISCGNCKTTIEQFTIIPAEIPMRPISCTTDCLQEFLKQELLHGENRVQCSSCKQKSNHTKHYEIKMATSRFIVIQVKRYKRTEKAGIQKNCTPVLVSRLLALGEVRQRMYKLVAVQKNCYLLFYQQVEVNNPFIERKSRKVRQDTSIRSILKSDDTDLLSLHYNERITTLDIKWLQEHGWLNDKIVNLYFKLIRAECPNVSVMDTFFYTAIQENRHPERFIKPETFLKEYVLIPTEEHHHWILLVVNTESLTVEVLDSGKTATHRGNIISDYLEQSDVSLGRLNVEEFQDLPKQRNSNDCGVFMCQFAVCRAFQQHVNFTQEHIQDYRDAMLLECIAGRLLPRL